MTRFLLLAFAGYIIWSGIQATRSPRTRVLYRSLRPRHFGHAALALLLVIPTGLALSFVPYADLSWWAFVQAPPSGGLVGGAVTAGGDPSEGSVMGLAIAIAVVLALVAFMPLIVTAEERMFRRGGHRRTSWRNAAASMAFGFMHMLVGVPIWAALALSLFGGLLQRTYGLEYARTASPHRALLASSQLHLAYNLIIVSVLGLAVALLYLLAP